MPCLLLIHHTAMPCCACAGDKDGRFKGVLDCFVQTARQDGLGAFYKGFLPNFARLGSWNVAMFLVLEQMKVVFAPKD